MPFPSKPEARGPSKACAFGSARLLARTDFPDFFCSSVRGFPDYQWREIQNIYGGGREWSV